MTHTHTHSDGRKRTKKERKKMPTKEEEEEEKSLRERGIVHACFLKTPCRAEMFFLYTKSQCEQHTHTHQQKKKKKKKKKEDDGGSREIISDGITRLSRGYDPLPAQPSAEHSQSQS